MKLEQTPAMKQLPLMEAEVKTKEKLEAFIDKFGINPLLDMLTEICYEKAEHIEANWQDKALAKMWIKDAKALAKVGAKLVDVMR
jgi:hypothetical protein